MKNTFKTLLTDFWIYLILCVSTYLMLRTIILYSSMEDDVAFLKVKQEYLGNPIWKTAFYVHVFTSLLTLLAGFTQFSNDLLKEYKTVHRWMGKLYVFTILFINFPSGMVMAIYANGLLPSKVAFFILDTLWFYFTWKAYRAIRQKKILEHRMYMIRSYALTFSAITLRTWKLVLSSLFVIDPLSLYMMDAWLGFVPNLLFAEWLILRIKKKSTSKIHVGQNDQADH